MPQGRRKVPFSTKQKKQQLKEKRERKATRDRDNDFEYQSRSDKQDALSGSKDNQTRSVDSSKPNPNRYVLQFYRETKAELQERKELGRQAFQHAAVDETEIDIYDYFPEGIGFPKRPSWDYNMSKDAVESQERESFQDYISVLKSTFNWNKVNYFELNLETWRQLWRVLEMSDIVLLIVDIRYPALMFPPSLYDYVVNKIGKDMILVLNKIDLSPAPLVVAWKHYLKKIFPSLHVLAFTSFPSYNLHGNLEKTGLQGFKKRGRLRMAAEGAQKLLETCQSIVGESVNLESWRNKIKEEMSTEYESEELEIDELLSMRKVDTTYHEHVKYGDGVLTIGCIGQPNVGKSSLMNALMGKKVVSVSKTPGHTKHFQTIFLTKNVKLCDCPGLVFPSFVPKTLQILMGSYPIAQVREPYTTIRYLAERIDLIKLLHLQHPDNDDEWSAIDICDAWAKARGFFAAKSGRADTYRAANHLLRMALEGKICLCLRPIGYTRNEDYWESHPDVKGIMWIQQQSSNKITKVQRTELEFGDGDDDDDDETDDDEEEVGSEHDDDNDGENNADSGTTDDSD